jgi:hypothetical protein
VKPNGEIDQVYCLTADQGHTWIHVFDSLPVSARRRLRSSAFNICAACLVSFVLPKVKAAHPSWSHEKMLVAGIEIMEAQVRKKKT